ncbi:unnamed protein product [Prorocentrum cordatum]|nr:unnamed protein product [Polarella glacialis]
MSVAIRVKPSPGTAPEGIAIWAKPPEEGGARQRTICCHRGYTLEEYEFSRVFGPGDDNEALFHDLQGPALTSSVFAGVNETLFAYGQTGSGKTHTIFGSARERGLLELFVVAFFQRAETCPGSTVHACCYEVLGDALTDLVNPQRLIEQGDLHSEDVVSDELFVKTHLCRYQIVRVTRVETCLDLLHEARANRTEGVSSCNASSSRSHAVVHLFVQNPTGGVPHQSPEGGSQSTVGALTLVDLAGTEKEHENPSELGKRTARLLNTSLSSLNRLLRKLQTGSLDGSERRQSVLNKCLWEYLRPGCGIAMIFCVSPLVRHRAITLSTLAMATDSKLIRSQRKSHYIQIPAAQASPPGARAHMQATPSQSPRSARSSLASPPAARGTEGRGTPSSAPRRASSTGASSASGRAQDLSASARSSVASSRLRFSASDAASDRPSAKDLESLTELQFEKGCPQTLRDLALQNTSLRRKLHRVRAKSAERVENAERCREHLGADLAATQRECESLRALFIRQQQQQIAFWTGPFMDMITPKDATLARHEPAPRPFPPEAVGAMHCPAAAWAPMDSPWEGTPSGALTARTSSARPLASFGGGALPPPAAAATPTAQVPLEASALRAAGAPVMPVPAAGDDRSTCLDSLRMERDYWRSVASDLRREMHGGSQKSGGGHSQGGARQDCKAQAPGTWDCGGSSTSQTVQESSGGSPRRCRNPSRLAWSDTDSELSSVSLTAEA